MERYLLVFLMVFVFGFSDGNYDEGFHIPKDLSYLDLSKKQKYEIEKLLKVHRNKLKKLHELEEKIEKELEKEFVKDKFNKNKFLEKNLKLKEQIARLEADFFAKIHSLLNKTQREKFVRYIEEWEIE